MNRNTDTFEPAVVAPGGYSFDRVQLDLAKGRLVIDDKEVGAPALPLRLLQVLCEKPGVLVTRKELFDYIWPRQVATYEALTKVIGRLRELLGPYGARVVTVRNRGVRLDATVRRVESYAPAPAPALSVEETPAAEPTTAPIVLIVDDSPDSILLLTETLKDHYRTKIATNGPSALKAATRAPQPDLILLDVSMPEMDGYELCETLKRSPVTAHIPVIFLTGRIRPAEETRGFEVGAIDYIAKPISQPVVLARVATHLKLAQVQRALETQNERLEDLVRVRTEQLTRVQDAIIVAMASLAEARDDETGNHIRRTQHYVALLARQLQNHPRFSYELSDGSIRLLFKSAPLHDIGKVGVPDQVLCKDSALTPEEFEIIKKHTTWGGDAIRSVEQYLGESSDFLRFAREIAYSHQEHWDGSGYPEGLAGDEIPISARLMAVADVYDALRSRRRYKPSYPHEKAVALLEQGRATHFDPDIVDAFLQVHEEFRAISMEYSDEETAAEKVVALTR
ncbi:MAG TPA: HD domain-containing phosphohydrolase [Rudaea sp.]